MRTASSPATIRRVLLALGPEVLAALTTDRHLAAQVRVPAGTSEIDVLAALLDGVDLTGVVVTADALHT